MGSEGWVFLGWVALLHVFGRSGLHGLSLRLLSLVPALELAAEDFIFTCGNANSPTEIFDHIAIIIPEVWFVAQAHALIPEPDPLLETCVIHALTEHTLFIWSIWLQEVRARFIPLILNSFTLDPPHSVALGVPSLPLVIAFFIIIVPGEAIAVRGENIPWMLVSRTLDHGLQAIHESVLL